MLLNKIHSNLILIFIILGTLLIGCQKESPSEVQKEQFLKTYGGSYDNVAVDFLYDNGNYYLLGNSPDKNGSYSILLTKTDEYGNRIWEQNYTIEEASTQANQFIKLEKQLGFAIIGSVVTDATTYFSDICLLIVDEQGSILKQVVYTDSLNQSGKCITEWTTGELVMVGTEAINATANPNNCLFHKTNVDGTKVREPNESPGINVSITGICNNNTDDFIYVTGSNDGKPRIHLIKPDGDYESWSTLNIAGQINSMVKNDNRLFICGYYSNGSNRANDVMVAEIEYDTEFTNFQILWESTFGFSGNDRGMNVNLTSENHLIISGTTQDTKLNTNNVYLVETDDSGALVKSNTFGGSGNESGVKSIETTDNRIVTLSTAYFGSNSMITLLKFDWE